MPLYYNGYSPAERSRRNRELRRQRGSRPRGSVKGPCEICGDPQPPFDTHAEDCSWPYKPSGRVMCHVCHRRKLHGRFAHPLNWQAYCAHVRRGGYGRDLSNPEVKAELKKYQAALSNGEKPRPLEALRGRNKRRDGWWAKLTCDREILSRFDSRVRAREDIKRAMRKALLELKPEHLELVKAHYKLPERTATMKELAIKLSYKSPQQIAKIYQEAGRIICDHSEYDAPKRENGSRDWMTIIAYDSRRQKSQPHQWTMNSSFAAALRSLRLISD